MLIGGVFMGLLVLGLFFTMLSSSPNADEPLAQELHEDGPAELPQTASVPCIQQ